MADVAALVVALSAQLTKFEKDMKDAVGIADKQTKAIEDRFGAMNKAIEAQVSGMVATAAGRIGGLGSVLGAIGPVGLTVAAAIGAVALSLDFITGKVDKFAQSAREMRDSAETLGISTEALKALGVVGQQVGLDFEQTERGTRKLALSVQDLREKGSGPLFDVLLKVNKGLIEQIAGAKDVTTAIDLLSAAYKNLNQQQQLQLSTALGGQRNLGIGRILGALPEGGLTQKAQEQLDKGFSPDLIERVAKLRQEIEAIQKRTDTIWGTAFAEGNLTASKAMATAWEAIALGVANTVKNFPGLSSFFTSVQRGAQKALDAQKGIVGGTPAPTQGARPDIQTDTAAPYDKEAAAIEANKQALVARLNVLKEQNAVIGDALTQAEQYKQKQLELTVAVNQGKVEQADANRQLAEYSLKAREATVAIKERLGIASLQEITDVRQQRVNADATKYALSAEDAERGRAKAVLDSEKAYEAMLVAASKTPELTRYALDAANQMKQFDTFATSALTGFETQLGNVANGTTKLADAFKSMANSIISDLVRIAVRMSVTGPLAKALSGLFGGGATAAFPEGLNSVGVTAPISSGVFLPQRQGGGPVSASNPYIVGEHGAELFVPNSSGQIVPGNIVRPSGSSGMNVTVNNYTAPDTDVRQSRQQGPSGETLIIDVVKRNMARGAFDDTNRGRFGLRAQKVR